MRIKFFFVLLFFITAVCVFSQQQQSEQDWFTGKPISDILFSGIKNTSQSELEALMFPYKGRIYDEDLYIEILTKLFALNYFINIDVSTQRADGGSKVILMFTVTEFPVIGRINYSGNSALRRSELSDVISTKITDIHNPVKIRADVEAIKNKYTEKGFPNATVSVTETPSGDSSINLTFVINEGNKITIKNIEFQGNTKFSQKVLKGQLSLKAKTLLNDGAFQEAKLIADIEAVTKYYQDRGYIDAAVKDVTRTYDTDDKGTNMTITFMIEEGSSFTFGGVTFDGNIIFSTEQLDKLIYSKIGDTVNFTRLMTDLQRVSDLYYENGYIFNTIERITHKDEQTNVISYTVFIVERGRAYIEDIVIVGNEKTKTEVILREIPLEPGDVFSKTKVMDAMRNLYNLQFFSMVMPDTLPGSAENLMVLVFTVEEQPTTDVQFGFTFSGSSDPESFPISGMIKWNDRNLAGTGNQIGAEVNSSVVDTTSMSLNYLHRWIMGLPLSGGVDLSADFSRRFATMNNTAPFFNGDETNFAFPDGFQSYEEYRAHDRLPPKDYLMEFRQWYLSLGFSTGYRWNTFLGIAGISGGTRFGIIKNIYDASLFRPFDPALRSGNNEWMPKNSFWLSLSLDQRDIFYDPSKGYYFYNRTGFFGILNSEREHYIRDDLKIQYYYPLVNLPVTEKWNFRIIFAAQAGLSTIWKQPGRTPDSRVPMVEDVNKLSVDGMFVGRGWKNEYRNKGLLLFDNWMELRFPLVNGILAFDIFFDAAGIETTQGYYLGRNENGDPNFTIDNWRFSLGGGLRFTIPQFPFRLGLAKRFRFIDGEFNWEPGELFGDPNNPAKGLDLVISFVLSY
ncbi:MAG: outer membrane protein assembly factor BamA [Treponema sp.]|jgi:outer membrane protein insertion porin family|nr:outer membrane protein assembly factor BamA [Treponema sp.]